MGRFKRLLSKTKIQTYKGRENIWWAFLIILLSELLIFWILMFLNASVVNWINFWFFIWIQLAPILMIIIMKRNLNNKNKTGESLLIRKGSVRAFLMLTIILVIISYALANTGSTIPIPIPFLVAFSIILIYYEIKPEDVLPKGFIVEIPEKYGTISRMPVVSTVIEKATDKLSSIQDKLNFFQNQIAAGVANVQAQFNRLKVIWDDQLGKILDKTDSLVIKSKNKWEQAGLMGLLIFIAFANLMFIQTRTDPLDGLAIASASLLSVVSIAFGINIQEIMLDKVKPQLENVFLEIDKALYATKNVINTTFNAAITNINDIQTGLNNIQNSNLLTFFPKDVVAIITVNLMVFISGLVIMIPVFSTNQWVLIGIEFTIGYYFMTKK